ncbi:MAG: 2TM domain-containing protein [Candidatus Geothermincolia bacterium]
MPEEETKSEDQELREKAEKRVSERMSLWWYLGSWVVINLFMVVIWLLSGRGYPWFLWVLAATSIGVCFSLVGYFSGNRSDSRKDKMVAKEMEKIKQEK